MKNILAQKIPSLEKFSTIKIQPLNVNKKFRKFLSQVSFPCLSLMFIKPTSSFQKPTQQLRHLKHYFTQQNKSTLVICSLIEFMMT